MLLMSVTVLDEEGDNVVTWIDDMYEVDSALTSPPPSTQIDQASSVPPTPRQHQQPIRQGQRIDDVRMAHNSPIANGQDQDQDQGSDERDSTDDVGSASGLPGTAPLSQSDEYQEDEEMAQEHV
jgi:hypothetical protein